MDTTPYDGVICRDGQLSRKGDRVGVKKLGVQYSRNSFELHI